MVFIILELTSSGNLTSNNTDYMKLPSGPTSDRPTNTISGYVRYNTSLKKFEGLVILGWFWKEHLLMELRNLF